MYIAAVERNPDITSIVRQGTANFSDYDYPQLKDEDPFTILTKDLKILDKAFEFALEIRNVALITYILEGAEK